MRILKYFIYNVDCILCVWSRVLLLFLLGLFIGNYGSFLMVTGAAVFSFVAMMFFMFLALFSNEDTSN